MSSQQPYPEPMRASYGERFGCIGSACEENCCQGWAIPVDQATFTRYTQVPEIAARIGGLNHAQPDPNAAILVRLEPTAIDHARIQLLPDGLCPFLDVQKLCGIQKQYGEGYMPEVCASYPRAQRSVFGVIERALHLSCPEAARLVLLDPNLLKPQRFETPAQTIRPGPSYNDMRSTATAGAEANTEANAETGSEVSAEASDRLSRAQPHLHLKVRDLILLLLMDRRYLLWQRLFLLGVFCSRLGQIFDPTHAESGQPQTLKSSPAIANLLADYAALFASECLQPALSRIEPQPEQQLATVFELLQLRLAGQVIQPRLLDCLQRFELGLSHPTASAAEQLQRYNEAAALYYRPLMEQHPYVLENYLANYVFKNRFPFGHGLDAAEISAADATPAPSLATPHLEHMILTIHYTLVQGLLIGISAHHREEFALTHVVELIQCLSKAMDHNAGFLRTLEHYGIKRRLDRHERMAMLVSL